MHDHDANRRPFRLTGFTSRLWWRIHRKRLLGCGAVTALGFLLWLYLFLRHGTLSPIAVWAYTKAYDHREAIKSVNPRVSMPGWVMPPTYDLYLSGQPPPIGWRPSSRLVVTLSTLPHHTHLLTPTLHSLLAQSARADTIYVAVPEISRRTGKPYGNVTVPDGVTVLRSEKDYGPLTKLLPAVMAERDPSTIIITVDDDKIYDTDLLLHLAWHAEHK